jgi:GNAT superfamily N-acetyltransferase
MKFRFLSDKDHIHYLSLINKFKPVNNDNSNQYLDTLNKIREIGNIIVCETDDKIVATLTYFIEHKFIHNFSKYGYIEDIFVDPEYQRRGIAKKIIELATLCLKSENCLKCKLNCSPDLENFYKKTNFKDNGISMINLLN